MTERNIATEVLDGLREIAEHRAGKLTLRTVRVEPGHSSNSPRTPSAISGTDSTSPGRCSRT